MGADPLVGVGDDLLRSSARAPGSAGEEAGAVAEEEAQVGGAVRGDAGDRDAVAGDFLAEGCEFLEGG